MSRTSYVWPHRVSLYELDTRDQVPCSTLFRYFEETAMRASTELGFSLDWYKERGQFWVIRMMLMERNCAAQYEEQLDVRTWVSAMTRLRADRNYVATRVRDGRLLARATANWVYLDGQKMQPTRIAPEIVARFMDLEPPALPPHRRSRPDQAVAEATARPMLRRAQHFEADSARHINNAVYVDWLEEAVREALSELGYPTPLDLAPAAPWFYRHWVEYLRGAVPGDELRILTRLVRRGTSAGYWAQEIRHAQSDELMARGECVTIWVDAANKPVVWPQAGARRSAQEV